MADKTELTAYREAVSDRRVLPPGESSDFYIASHKQRHEACKCCGNGGTVSVDEKATHQVNLAILGVSRQSYEEASYLLMATNTFSFEDPLSFAMFISDLNPSQKRNLRSMHLSLDIGLVDSSAPMSGLRDWRWARFQAHVHMLQNLQNLHLCFEQHLGKHDSASTVAIGGPSDTKLKNAQDKDIRPFLRLRPLAIKLVTVIVSDNGAEMAADGTTGRRWTAMQKNQYAEDLRAQLTDPRGAEIVKDEAQAAAVARVQAKKARDAAYISMLERKANRAQVKAKGLKEKVRQMDSLAYNALWKAKYANDKSDEAEADCKSIGRQLRLYSKARRALDWQHTREWMADKHREKVSKAAKAAARCRAFAKEKRAEYRKAGRV